MLTAPLQLFKSWLAARSQHGTQETVVVAAPEALRSDGYPDLILEKLLPTHLDEIVDATDASSPTQKPRPWTELSHLVGWSNGFATLLENHKLVLVALQMVSGLNDYPISVAKFQVDEAVAVVRNALSFMSGLYFHHPDTRSNNYACNNILVEDSTTLHDIVRQVFARLYSKCVVRLVVKSNHFYSAALTEFVVDLMHHAGATNSEISCVCLDRRDTIGNERLGKCLTPTRNSKLSVIAIVFKATDTFSATQSILDSYFRELFPNLIVLVEESVYDRFIKDWQRYYSHAVQIGSQLDEKTTITDSFNSEVMIDLAAIDIKTSHKMSGHAINVLKFRSMAELTTLLNQLRKVPYMSIWNDDILLSREFSLKANQSSDFWLNHIPQSILGQRFSEDFCNLYYDTVIEDMTEIYNTVIVQFQEEVELLRKSQANFSKKSYRLRTSLVLQSFISLVTKSKSLKSSPTVGESIASLRKFQMSFTHMMSTFEVKQSRIETFFKPIGLAIILVREENSMKSNQSKSLLVEFIFKNLLIGNAVLLVCPANTLGVKFSLENDHVIPFKMVQDGLPDMSKLSLESSVDSSDTMPVKKQCPKNTYAVEVLPEYTSEMFETLIVALGTQRKRIWYPDDEVLNYWSSET